MVTVMEGCGSGDLAVEWMRKAFSGEMQWPFQHAVVDVLEMDNTKASSSQHCLFFKYM